MIALRSKHFRSFIKIVATMCSKIPPWMWCSNNSKTVSVLFRLRSYSCRCVYFTFTKCELLKRKKPSIIDNNGDYMTFSQNTAWVCRVVWIHEWEFYAQPRNGKYLRTSTSTSTLASHRGVESESARCLSAQSGCWMTLASLPFANLLAKIFLVVNE